MTIPLPIETERLLIRPFETADVDSMADIYGDLAERLGMPAVETIDVDGRPHLLLALECA